MSRNIEDENTLTDSDSQYAEVYDDDDDGMKSQVIPAFLSKTYAIMHSDDFKDVVCWGENGESILILKVDDFSKRVLPLYFKHGNFSSFVRQLNMYGFHKTRQDPNWREFKHPLFKRGHIELLPSIKRKNGNIKAKPEKRERSSDFSEKAITVNMKKSKIDRDTILRDLTLLKRQTAEMELKHSNVLQENRLLWQSLMKSKEQQDQMKLQMERICRFIVKVLPVNRIRDFNDTVNSFMLTDKPRPMDITMDNLDYSMSGGDDGLLTPDQYNGTLDFLQMNTVPRLDSPRMMPMRSTQDDGRKQYSNARMLTNGGSLSSLQHRQSLVFPGSSPSLSPNMLPSLSSDIFSLPLDDHTPSRGHSHHHDDRHQLVMASSSIPPLDLGEPFIRDDPMTPVSLPGSSDMLILDTSKSAPLELYSSSSYTPHGIAVPSSSSHTPSYNLSYSGHQNDVIDILRFDCHPDDQFQTLESEVKKVDEQGMMLQRRLSQMETGLSSPFLVPNIEVMEQQGML